MDVYVGFCAGVGVAMFATGVGVYRCVPVCCESVCVDVWMKVCMSVWCGCKCRTHTCIHTHPHTHTEWVCVCRHKPCMCVYVFVSMHTLTHMCVNKSFIDYINHICMFVNI